MNSNQSGTEPARAPAIGTQLEILESNIDSLAKTVECLGERLKPVSRPDEETPKPIEKALPPPALPAVGESIRQALGRVHHIETRVRRISSLLEI